MTFLEEIQRRSESQSIEGIRQDVWENYGDLMFGSDVNTIQEMTNFQAGFLHLMDQKWTETFYPCLLYTSPSPRDRTRSRMPSSA